MWCLYKEVQNYYETGGLNPPDDITLLWAEDNNGNIRRLPTAAGTQTLRRRRHLLPLRLPRQPHRLPLGQHQPHLHDLGPDVPGQTVRRRPHLDRQRRQVQEPRIRHRLLAEPRLELQPLDQRHHARIHPALGHARIRPRTCRRNRRHHDQVHQVQRPAQARTPRHRAPTAR